MGVVTTGALRVFGGGGEVVGQFVSRYEREGDGDVLSVIKV